MIKIKNIIRYEQLSGKSFSDFDCTNENDALILIYCIELPKSTFEEFITAAKVSDLAISNSLKEINNDLNFINQFTQKEPEQEEGEGNHIKIGDIVSYLLYSGLDTHYIMEELEVQDLPLFMKGFEENRKEKMENDRLWTFYKILPLVGKGIEEPQDIIQFPWEKNLREERAKKNIEDNKQIFEDLMNSTNIFKKS